MKIMLLIWTLFFSFIGISQNLVPNPSFENYNSLPCSFVLSQAGFNNAMIDWMMPTYGTSDIFSTTLATSCYSAALSINTDAIGQQLPRTGNIMSMVNTYGLGCGTGTGAPDYREYLEVPLISPLVLGTTYYAEMYVSHAEYSTEKSNNIGMYFSNTLINSPICSQLNFTPQVNETAVIADGVNWVKISGTFVATTAAEYLIIGNFFDDANTIFISDTTQNVANARYFVDDVSVVAQCSTVSMDTTICANQPLTLFVNTDSLIGWALDTAPGIIVSTDTLFNVSPVATTTYLVYSNCDTNAVTITVNGNTSNLLGSDTTLCFGELLNLEVTAVNSNYLWHDGSVDSSYVVSQPGTFWVEVSDNNCTYVDSVTVNYTPFFNVNLGPDTTICELDTLWLDASVLNANYLWHDGATSATFEVLQQGDYWVEVTVNGCKNVDSITVNLTPLPTIDLGNDTTLCVNTSLLLDASNVNASYLWQNNAVTATITASQQGVYWVEVTKNNCVFSDSIFISYNPISSIDLGNDTVICTLGNTIQLDATFPNATYLWQDGAVGPLYTANQQGVYWVQVTLDNCSFTDSIEIDTSFYTLPSMTLGNDTIICQGESILLDVSTINATYLWQDNSVNASLSVNTPGIFYVDVNFNGCVKSDTIQIVYQNLNPNFSLQKASVCFPQQVNFFNQSTVNIGSIDSWYWNFDNNDFSVIENPSSTFNHSATYDLSLRVTSNIGCVKTITIPWMVEVEPEVKSNFNFSPNEGVAGETDISFFNLSSNSDQFLWDFGDNTISTAMNPTHIFEQEGNYTIILISLNELGCSDTTSYSLTVGAPMSIFVPNVFTPNGQGSNQEWRFDVLGIDIYDFSVLLFNRWGEVIWESRNPNAGWDGVYNGTPVNAGVYVWRMEFTSPTKNEKQILNGHVTLLR
ncbi:hypothetical protein DNU06_00995 [Putridiphycobacter roseus]|uniref:PKD domain-containing protein n=1 Tax=Putridiphycobacter roseus TaxID=2219161 RepID=A0A2W1NS21_9FLAO|nr:PKD domain-containing protein [Putridiphycobacter roseus]PZE18442.1 hypothetical protein DNU06_00995 [Putridiphycobacter roseus]